MNEIENWLEKKLYDHLPMAMCVIDRQHRIVHHNEEFIKVFGEGIGKSCHMLQGARSSRCPGCMSGEVFHGSGKQQFHDIRHNASGSLKRYIRHLIPMPEGSSPTHLLEVWVDVPVSRQVRRDYQVFFDMVPCNILIINRALKVVSMNDRARGVLGDIVGQSCHEVLKGSGDVCSGCTAMKTFGDAEVHEGRHAWRMKNGLAAQMHVVTAPLMNEDGSFDAVMEMAVDVTQTIQLKEDLNYAHTFLETIIASSADPIFAIDEYGDVTICNPAARKLFGIETGCAVTAGEIEMLLPGGFVGTVLESRRPVYLAETYVRSRSREVIPVAMSGSRLMLDGQHAGMAVIIQDLRELKQLQEEKMEAEKLAVVGQTVAGLAHGVKNLVNSLEGGLYMLSTGLTRSDVERVGKGVEMLDRNITRLSGFVRAFLDFARGRKLSLQAVDPMDLAREVIENNRVRAADLSIELTMEGSLRSDLMELDYECILECLSNLVANAMDACDTCMETAEKKVTLRVFDRNDCLVYAVSDNGYGMSEEVQEKVFTRFFTTKGLDGTGLGLLMTRKLVREHGGEVDFISDVGIGSTFEIVIPRTVMGQGKVIK